MSSPIHRLLLLAILGLTLCLQTPLTHAQNTTNSSSTLPPGEDPDDIRGGSPSPAIPYYGVFNDFGSVCGAALVWGDIALTAAHCVTTSFPPTLRFNSAQRTSGGTTVGVTSRTLHPDWSGTITTADLAILKLNGFLNFSPVTLNTDANSPSTNGQLMFAAGFGLTSSSSGVSNTLQATRIPYITDCTGSLAGFNNARMVCGDSISTATCGGDSGSPIFLDGTTTQIGINSWSDDGCDTQTRDVYTRVSFYEPWIQNEICAQSSAPPDGICDGVPRPTPSPNAGVPSAAPGDEGCSWFENCFEAFEEARASLRGTVSRLMGGW